MPKFLYVSMGLENHDTAVMSFYDLEFHKLPFHRADYKEIKFDIKKPKNFEEMIEIARKLSNGIPFVRVDLYDVEDQVFFSELTFIPNSGLMPFEPKKWDVTLGEYFTLPSTPLCRLMDHHK